MEIGLSASGDRIVTGNEVFLLDLDGVDPIARASEIVRRKVRRARESGVELVTDRTLLGEHLARLYPPSMERLGASEAYRYDQASLKALALAPEALVVGAMLDGEVEAVSVFLRAGHRAEYLCNGSSERGRDLATWLIAQAAALLREEGVKELNLGGGITPAMACISSRPVSTAACKDCGRLAKSTTLRATPVCARAKERSLRTLVSSLSHPVGA